MCMYIFKLTYMLVNMYIFKLYIYVYIFNLTWGYYIVECKICIISDKHKTAKQFYTSTALTVSPNP